jgi:hypothetical protein
MPRVAWFVAQCLGSERTMNHNSLICLCFQDEFYQWRSSETPESDLAFHFESFFECKTKPEKRAVTRFRCQEAGPNLVDRVSRKCLLRVPPFESRERCLRRLSTM